MNSLRKLFENLRKFEENLNKIYLRKQNYEKS